MPDQGAFRQVDEKHVAVEAELIVWSPKFDLVALSNVQGEVVLHRLSWQKVWSLPPHSEEAKVKAMSWRPDGKVLAVGYNTGHTILCYIENAEVLHTIDAGSEVTCLAWVCQSLQGGEAWTCDPYLEDNTEMYLPKLQPLNKSYGSLSKGNVEENVEDKKKLKGQKELNLLIIGSKSQDVQLYIYGVFPVAKVKVGDSGSEAAEIVSAVLSEDLNSLAVVLKETSHDEAEFILHSFDTSVLTTHDKELHLLSLKYGHISTLIQYLESTIQQMQEAWEDILLEMDSKLYNFAEQKQASGAGTVGNDFLELLLFGTPSSELQTFLLLELTDKGLKKLGHSIETSYSNIQKLVVKHLQTVSRAILYHMSELKGMAKCEEKFGILGVDPALLHKALMSAGSFVLKTIELQQVIDGSIKNFKAFFRWLYVVILRLSDEKPPSELSKMTQRDVNFVADFLRDNFAQFTPKEEEESIEDLRAISPTDKKSGFKLEKVGQYLKKENLHYPPDVSGNPWVQFCRASYSLKDSQVLYPVESNKSLLQLQEALETKTYNTLNKPSTTIGQSMQCAFTTFLYSVPVVDDDAKPFVPRFAQFTSGSQSSLFTVFTADFCPAEKVYVLRQPTCAHTLQGNMCLISVKFSSLQRPDLNCSNESSQSRGSGSLSVLDIACYDDKHLSVLLVENTDDQTPVLLQLPLSLITDTDGINITNFVGVNSHTDIPVLEINSDTEGIQYRWLANMKAHSFAVSGTRHTATVLFSSRRRVRIFLMDADDDDDDDDDDITDGDITAQSEADQSAVSAIDINQSACSSKDDASQSELTMQIDSSETGEEDEGQEGKENSSGPASIRQHSNT